MLRARTPERLFYRVTSPLTLLISLVLLSLAPGCVAFHEPLADNASGPNLQSPELAALHLRLRLPRMDDLRPEQLRYVKQGPTREVVVANARRALAKLEDTAVFASVESDDTPASGRVVFATMVLPEVEGFCRHDFFWLPYVSLGLLPDACKRDVGVYLRFRKLDLVGFRCPWPQTRVHGWLPAFALVGLSDWKREPDEDAAVARLRRCIGVQSALFVFSAEDP